MTNPKRSFGWSILSLFLNFYTPHRCTIRCSFEGIFTIFLYSSTQHCFYYFVTFTELSNPIVLILLFVIPFRISRCRIYPFRDVTTGDGTTRPTESIIELIKVAIQVGIEIECIYVLNRINCPMCNLLNSLASEELGHTTQLKQQNHHHHHRIRVRIHDGATKNRSGSQRKSPNNNNITIIE